MNIVINAGCFGDVPSIAPRDLATCTPTMSTLLSEGRPRDGPQARQAPRGCCFRRPAFDAGRAVYRRTLNYGRKIREAAARTRRAFGLKKRGRRVGIHHRRIGGHSRRPYRHAIKRAMAIVSPEATPRRETPAAPRRPRRRRPPEDIRSATSTSAPASTASDAVEESMPPSTWSRRPGYFSRSARASAGPPSKRLAAAARRDGQDVDHVHEPRVQERRYGGDWRLRRPGTSQRRTRLF